MKNPPWSSRIKRSVTPGLIFCSPLPKFVFEFVRFSYHSSLVKALFSLSIEPFCGMALSFQPAFDLVADMTASKFLLILYLTHSIIHHPNQISPSIGVKGFTHIYSHFAAISTDGEDLNNERSVKRTQKGDQIYTWTH